ncbi:TRAP transporter substrate-binding protein DctP [Alkalihalobacillus oceani]|uniref:TRAP transporter substrate-binding protein n=1 Tax=Halalkalibacter oceani TaxID=1653776 RepID=UPI002041D36B|nr:TRAP transporter substrate-binding protein DctP [Halalkalibacter oceani]MCM3761792.1 TRAP transporter substrate-binding protein DctP [Halalkalibacter oceani]
MKKLMMLMMLLVLSFVLVACGGSEEGSAPADGGEGEAPAAEGEAAVDGEFIMKIAHSAPAQDDKTENSLQEFKKRVEEATDGRIVVETYPASQLGGEREILEGTQLGSIEAHSISTGPYPGVFPEIMVLSIPYLFVNKDVAYEVLDGPFGEKMKELLLEKTGLRLLAWGENGVRHFTNNTNPIQTPEDMRGISFRTMENPAHMAMVEALGGSATPIAYGELYSALQQGVVDGQENPVTNIASMRFYEVQKYATLDGHVYDPHLFAVNNAWFESLPEDLQTILQEEAAAWSDYNRQMSTEQDDGAIETMIEAGMEIIELTPEELVPFQEATQSVHDLIKSEAGEDIYNEIMAAVEEAEAAVLN